MALSCGLFYCSTKKCYNKKWDFDKKIKPNTLPENLTTLTFGWKFDKKLEPNTLPENLITLTFGCYFSQKIEPNTLPWNLTTLAFGRCFDQKIEPKILPENLTTLTFERNFNQIIDSKILPSNLINIVFNWKFFDEFDENDLIKHYIEMVNNIPSYYHVKILLRNNIFGDSGLKWPIHVIHYEESEWSSNIYEIHNKYSHQFYGFITILINKETYQSYSFAKSALK